MATKKTWRHGTPLEAPVQERLLAFIREVGQEEVSKQTGLSCKSIAYAAAGMSLRNVTRVAIERTLDVIRPVVAVKPPAAMKSAKGGK